MHGVFRPLASSSLHLYCSVDLSIEYRIDSFLKLSNISIRFETIEYRTYRFFFETIEHHHNIIILSGFEYVTSNVVSIRFEILGYRIKSFRTLSNVVSIRFFQHIDYRFTNRFEIIKYRIELRFVSRSNTAVI